jgi:hypothetical protein
VELGQELKRATPTTDGSYEFIYLSKAPRLELSEGFADHRMRKVDGNEVIGHVFLRYRARYVTPPAIDVSGSDIEHCRRMLEAARVPFEFIVTRKNDFGQPAGGTFKLAAAFNCEVVLRPDYDSPAVHVELSNAGRLGSWRARIAPEEFTDGLLDQIAAYLLCAPSDFGNRVTR